MWWCEASITRTSSRSQRTTISPSISSTGCVLSMMMRVPPVALTAFITLTAWCQTTFICSFVSVMRKLVIPSRELQVHIYYYNHKYLRDGHLFKEHFKSEPVRSALPFSCYQRDARTIWLISRPFCAISTRILSRQVLLLRPRTISIAPDVNTMIPLKPVFQICNTQTVLNRIPLNDFNEWVNDPLPDVANFLDNRFRATSSQTFRWLGLATDCQNRRRFQ